MDADLIAVAIFAFVMGALLAHTLHHHRRPAKENDVSKLTDAITAFLPKLDAVLVALKAAQDANTAADDAAAQAINDAGAKIDAALTPGA